VLGNSTSQTSKGNCGAKEGNPQAKVFHSGEGGDSFMGGEKHVFPRCKGGGKRSRVSSKKRPVEEGSEFQTRSEIE